MLALVLARVWSGATRSTRVGNACQRTASLPALALSALSQKGSHTASVWATRSFGSSGRHGTVLLALAHGSAAWTEQVAPAFRAYLRLHRHLLVPVAFVVPWGDDAWPRATWGYPLGRHSLWLRRRKRRDKPLPATITRDLDAMRFAWEVTQYKWDHFVLPALRCFYRQHGHTDVPCGFVVPEGEAQWPEHLWGYALGTTVQSVRQKKQFVVQVQATAKHLDALAFSYDTLTERNWRQQILPSLQVFRQEKGHCRVAQSFIVPSEAPWPERAWGRKLGVVVERMRSQRTYARQVARDKDILTELGFAWSSSQANWVERVLPSLQVFKAVHGHCRVPKDFSVPTGAPWPEQAWGVNLGFVAMGMKAGQSYTKQMTRDEDVLKALGFE